MDSPPNAQNRFERTFVPDHSKLSDEQVLAVGRVAVTWSVLEHMIDLVLARLALAPAYPALAITTDLSIDNQLKAMRVLLSLHEERYKGQIIQKPLLKTLKEMPKTIAKLKDERNAIVHTVWIRMGKEDYLRFPGKALTSGAAEQRHGRPAYTVTTVNALADKIQAVADELFAVIQHLVAVDEPSHAKALSQEVHPPFRVAKSEPQDPHQS